MRRPLNRSWKVLFGFEDERGVRQISESTVGTYHSAQGNDDGAVFADYAAIILLVYLEIKSRGDLGNGEFFRLGEKGGDKKF